MNSSSALRSEATCCSPALKAHHVPSTFSRPSHFACILAPVLLGVGAAVMSDVSSTILYRFGIFALLAASLSMGVGVLHSISRFENK